MNLDREKRHFLLHSLLGAFVRLRVEGLENVPEKGGCILVCNHSDLIDAVIQGLYSGRNVTFLAKAELFDPAFAEKLKSLKESASNEQDSSSRFEIGDELMNIISQIYMDASIMPIVRNYRGERAAEAVEYYRSTLEKIKTRLNTGEMIAIYPEGTRSTDGKLQRFKGFTARIALEAKKPIIPAAIKGAFGLSDWTTWVTGSFRNKSIIYKIGKAIQPSEFPPETGKHSVKILTRLIESRVRQLLT